VSALICFNAKVLPDSNEKQTNTTALTSERYSIDKKMLQRSFFYAAAKVKK